MTTALMMLLVSCEKVSPIGVLVSGTGVEDRIKMSHMYYSQHKDEYHMLILDDLGDYTFLVGADSHLTTDDGRMREMLQIGLDNDDLLYAHLGDIADTKAEYYITLENLIDEYRWKYAKKKYVEVYFGDDEYSKDDPDYYVYVDTVEEKSYNVHDVPLPFFPVVGNHDITHNGWALWSNIFHSSFYDVYVIVSADPLLFDHFIFLDTANGTLGTEQVKLIEQGVLDGKEIATQIGQEGSVSVIHLCSVIRTFLGRHRYNLPQPLLAKRHFSFSSSLTNGMPTLFLWGMSTNGMSRRTVTPYTLHLIPCVKPTVPLLETTWCECM